MTTIKETLEMLEEATLAKSGRVLEGTSLADLDGWDSMGMVVFMGLVKEQQGVELAVHELRSCGTPTEVSLLVKKMAGA